jgi:SAM-dependent methyltransferase
VASGDLDPVQPRDRRGRGKLVLTVNVVASGMARARLSPQGERLANLRRLREFELSRVLPKLAGYARVLELGAGPGFQARLIANAGHEVIALDIKPPPPAAQEFPVTEFNGRHLPFADGSIDAVFSSNVLEHVEDLSTLLREVARVLRPAGVSVHIVPSATWRIWTSVVHYPFLVKRLRERLAIPGEQSAAVDTALAPPAEAGLRLSKLAAAERHGAHGSALAEMFTFRRAAWRDLLSHAPFTLRDDYPLGIFYSGYSLMGSGLSLESRRSLSRLLGSSTHALVLEKAAAAPPVHSR